jgi:predicted DNA-binding protein
MSEDQKQAPREGVAINARVPAEVRKRLRLAAIEDDRDIGAVVREALEAWLSARESRT